MKLIKKRNKYVNKKKKEAMKKLKNYIEEYYIKGYKFFKLDSWNYTEYFEYLGSFDEVVNIIENYLNKNKIKYEIVKDGHTEDGFYPHGFFFK